MKPPTHVTQEAERLAPIHVRPGRWVVVAARGEPNAVAYGGERKAVWAAQRRHLLSGRHQVIISPTGTARVTMGIAIDDARRIIAERAMELHVQSSLVEDTGGRPTLG